MRVVRLRGAIAAELISLAIRSYRQAEKWKTTKNFCNRGPLSKFPSKSPWWTYKWLSLPHELDRLFCAPRGLLRLDSKILLQDRLPLERDTATPSIPFGLDHLGLG
jgi:hypothetical protein